MTPFRGQLADDAVGLGSQLVEQLLVVADAARDQLGRRDLAAAAVRERDGRDDDQDAVLREAPAVAQRDVLDVADAETVDERDAGLDRGRRSARRPA